MARSTRTIFLIGGYVEQVTGYLWHGALTLGVGNVALTIVTTKNMFIFAGNLKLQTIPKT